MKFPPVPPTDPSSDILNKWVDSIIEVFPHLNDREALRGICATVAINAISVARNDMTSKAIVSIANMYDRESLMAPISNAILEQAKNNPDRLLKALVSLVQGDAIEVILSLGDGKPAPQFKLIPDTIAVPTLIDPRLKRMVN